MSNLEKYEEAFIKSLELTKDVDLKSLEYQSIASWDSVGHMGLVAELEDVFEIMFDTDDIIDFSSYKKGIEILKKYNIEI